MWAVVSFTLGVLLTLVYIPINASLNAAVLSLRTSRSSLSKVESKADNTAVKSAIRASKLSLLALERLISTLKWILNLIKSMIVALLSVTSIVSFLILVLVVIVIALLSWLVLYFTMAEEEDGTTSKTVISLVLNSSASTSSGVSSLVSNAEKLGNWYESIYAKVGDTSYNNGGGYFRGLFKSESWYESKLTELNGFGLSDTRMDCSGYLTSILAMSGFFAGKGWNGNAYGSYRWNPERQECRNESWLYDNILSVEFDYYNMQEVSDFEFKVGDIVVSDYHIEIIGEINGDQIKSYSWGKAVSDCLRPRSNSSAYIAGTSVGLHHMSVVWRLKE